MSRREWTSFSSSGRCESCGLVVRDRVAHHVVLEQVVRRVAPERVYDVANRMLIGWRCCHERHHHYGVNDTRIPFEKVPERCRQFAREILGDGPAAIYFARHYRVTQPEGVGDVSS